MPLQVARESSWLRIVFAGEVSAVDLANLADRLEALERDLPVTPDRLADLSGLEGGELNFHTLHRLADRRRAAPPRNPIRTAIVAATPLAFGFARMFQTLNDHPLVTIRIFADAAGAEAWLGGPP